MYLSINIHTHNSHFAVHLKLITQHCKSSNFNLKNRKDDLGSWHNSEKITSSFWDSISLSLKRKEGEKVGLDSLLDLSPTVSPFQECSKRQGYTLSKTLNNLLGANTIMITNIIPILQKRKQKN